MKAEKKVVLTFTRDEISQLQIILTDKDKDAAFDFLKQCVNKKIKAIKTGLNPDLMRKNK